MKSYTITIAEIRDGGSIDNISKILNKKKINYDTKDNWFILQIDDNVDIDTILQKINNKKLYKFGMVALNNGISNKNLPISWDKLDQFGKTVDNLKG